VPGRYQFSLPERPRRDGWFRVGLAGGIDLTTTAIMVLLGVVSMFWYAISPESLADLVFSGRGVREGELWRVVTWPIPNPPDEIWVVLTLAFFWFVGHRVEDAIGRWRFLWLVLAATIAPAAIVSALSFDLSYGAYGLGVLGIAFLVVFALEHPSAMFFFNIPAWVIAAVYVGIDVLRYLGQQAYEPLVLELLVILVAVLGARQAGLLADLAAVPRVAGRRRPAASRRPRSSGPTVVEGPWGAGHGPSDAEQAELDALLDKIGAQGMDSLSRTEKTRLNELSAKLRKR